jgi:predicted nuclease of predicted toxin-antitoxin system
MKFKVDENLPVEVASLLRQAGYDAATVSEQLTRLIDVQIGGQTCIEVSR